MRIIERFNEFNNWRRRRANPQGKDGARIGDALERPENKSADNELCEELVLLLRQHTGMEIDPPAMLHPCDRFGAQPEGDTGEETSLRRVFGTIEADGVPFGIAVMTYSDHWSGGSPQNNLVVMGQDPGGWGTYRIIRSAVDYKRALEEFGYDREIL